MKWNFQADHTENYNTGMMTIYVVPLENIYSTFREKLIYFVDFNLFFAGAV